MLDDLKSLCAEIRDNWSHIIDPILFKYRDFVDSVEDTLLVGLQLLDDD